MKEKDIQTLFMKADVPLGAYELKLAKGTSIPYNSVKEHQIEGLRKVKSEEGLFYKINDMPAFAGSMTRFASPKPFDCFKLRCDKSYVAICYYKPRQPKMVLCIEIDDFVNAMENDTRKSMTEEKANEIKSFEIRV